MEYRDKDGYTPLLIAATYGHADTVHLLLRKGADFEAVEKNDKTAIYLACEEDKPEALAVSSNKIGKIISARGYGLEIQFNYFAQKASTFVLADIFCVFVTIKSYCESTLFCRYQFLWILEFMDVLGFQYAH